MLKNLSRLEAEVGQRKYHLYCEVDAPLNDVKEALFQFIKFIGQIEENVKAQQEAAAAEKKAAEVVEQQE